MYVSVTRERCFVGSRINNQTGQKDQREGIVEGKIRNGGIAERKIAGRKMGEGGFEV